MFLERWKIFLIQPGNRFKLFLVVLLFALFLYVFKLVLGLSAIRSNIRVFDPIHHYLPPVNFSVFIFLLTEGCLLLGVGVLSKNPHLFVYAAFLYLTQNLLRAYCIYLVPLAEPEGIIPLWDPFLDYTFYEGRTIKTDLFFSGHVSNLFLMGLILKKTKWRYLFYMASVGVGIFLVLQRVHYLIDVLFAPLASLIVYKGYNWLNRKILNRLRIF